MTDRISTQQEESLRSKFYQRFQKAYELDLDLSRDNQGRERLFDFKEGERDEEYLRVRDEYVKMMINLNACQSKVIPPFFGSYYSKLETVIKN
ncbi:MAG: hypothetical protein V1663_02770 [archaeon]